MAKKIKITCEGSGTMPLVDLRDFQGNLKMLDDSQFAKLKRQILKHGFSFPVFVWGDQMLDGHQRIYVLRHLVEQEGYKLDDDIPVVKIEAADEKEAAEKLLVLNSHYAKITFEGLYESLDDMNINIDETATDLELSDIDMASFLDGWVQDQEPNFKPGTEDEQGKLDELSPKMIKCPRCKTIFDLRDYEQG